MTAKKRHGKKAEGEPPAKRPPRGARLQDDPVWATTNQKSHMVNENLHAKFASPKTYEKWTKEDWDEMRTEGLPEDAPYAVDGYSVPIEYFKYNPDWRRCVREFQEDLGAGRYEPEWQAEAAQAMEERANGDFDKFKEDAFEEFWGQKQKMDHHAVAGESANIKLDELIEHGVVRLGDHLSYKRVFGKGKGALLIEKDAEIVKVEGSVLTFAVPLGKRKYAHGLPSAVLSAESPKKINQNENLETQVNSNGIEAKATPASDDIVMAEATIESYEDRTNLNLPANGNEKHEPSEYTALSHRIRQSTPEPLISPSKLNYTTPEAPPFSPITIPSTSTHPTPLKTQQEAEKSNTPFKSQPEDSDASANTTPSKVYKNRDTFEIPAKTQPETSTSSTPSNPHPPTTTSNHPTPSPETTTLVSILTLNQLEVAMIAASGHFKATGEKEPRIVNSWRAMRGIRNNQDLGTLWEMREEYFVYQHPKIVKMPKKKRQGSSTPVREASLTTEISTTGKKKMSRAERYKARAGDGDGGEDELA